MIEMIELILEHKDNPWFKHILNNRYIVIVPMTNPHGYHEKIRVSKKFSNDILEKKELI